MDRERLIAEEMGKREEIMNKFDQNYLLEAGAGAGKTTIIVQRIINHLMNSDVEPANIVAITFTKQASTELAERIQLKALEYLEDEKDSKIIAKLESIDEIFTGTIHSFCDLILREMPFEAGLSPGYEIIEDSHEFLNKIWYDFIRNSEKDYKDMTDLLWRLNIDYRELRTKAIVAMENPDIKFVGFKGGKKELEEIEVDFENLKAEYGNLEPGIFSEISNMGKILNGVLKEGGKLADYIASLLGEGKKYNLSREEAYGRFAKKAYLEEDYLESDEAIAYKNYVGELFTIYRDLNSLAYNTATDFINMAIDYKEKNFRGQITFNEILHKASSLIKKSESAREHFQGKYKYYYIDEFQDTDPMQADLIFHLTDGQGYKEDRYWQECKPRPGSLFVVGDPKQSIYRFRRADITIYNQVKEIISKNGSLVYLDINFRSSNKICSWVEKTFKEEESGFAFGQEASLYQAGFKRILSLWDDSLEKTIEAERGQLRGVYSYEGQQEAVDSNPEEEADYVGQIVEDLINNYCLVEKKSKASGNGENNHPRFYNLARKIEPKDIMILTKSKGETGIYLRALKDRNIPALLAGQKKLGDIREVLNLFLLIDALVDYRDNIKIIGALRNSFYLELDTIDQFLEEEGDLSTILFKRERIEKIRHPHLRDSFIYMWELNSLMRQLNPMTFLEYLIKGKTGVYNMDKDYSDLEKRDVQSSLLQSLEILRSKRCSSIYEIRNELEKLIESEIEYELPLNKEFADNASRVMNIHKSKGLEASIVFLVGRDRKIDKRGPGHFVKKDRHRGNLGYMVFKADLNILGPKEKDRKLEEEKYNLAEYHRQLYVAATRAKSALILGSTAGDNMYLDPLNRNINQKLTVEFESGKRSEISFSGRKELELDLTRDLRKRKEILAPSYYKISPSKLRYQGNNLENSYTDYSSPRFKGKKMVKSQKNIFAPRGKIYGELVHRAIEILIKENNQLEDIGGKLVDYASNLAIRESMDLMEINEENIGLLYPLNSKRVEEIIELRLSKGSQQAKEIIRARLGHFLKKDLNNFINNREIKDLFANAKNIYSELQFSIPIGRNNLDGLNKLSKLIDKKILEELYKKTAIVNGIIDLVIEGQDGSWLILDYKTDVVHKGDINRKLEERYGGQLKAYKIFLEDILKDRAVEVDKLLIYSTFRDELIYLQSPAMA